MDRTKAPTINKKLELQSETVTARNYLHIFILSIHIRIIYNASDFCICFSFQEKCCIEIVKQKASYHGN